MVSWRLMGNLLNEWQMMGNYQQPLPLAGDPFLRSHVLDFMGYLRIIRSYQRLFPPVGVCGVHFVLWMEILSIKTYPALLN